MTFCSEKVANSSKRTLEIASKNSKIAATTNSRSVLATTPDLSYFATTLGEVLKFSKYLKNSNISSNFFLNMKY